MTHKVVCLAYSDVQVLDVTGPLEVFGRASRWLSDQRRGAGPAYALEVVAEQAGPVLTSSPGIVLQAERSWRHVASADTLLIAGGKGWEHAAADPELRTWLRKLQAQGTRIASVCTGALILAKAGLLDGQRATTHWDYCDQLGQLAANCAVDADAIYLQISNKLYTSAGVTSGMDMALGLLEIDHDAGVALAVAQELVMFVKRPGGQSQFSRTLAVQAHDDDRLAALQSWMLDNVEADLSVPALAARVNMSPRNFARRFGQACGVSPARYVEQLRCEAARRRLEESDLPLARIAQQVGLGSAETLRRLFQRTLSMSPQEYRRRFSSTAGGSTA